jgi:hypothetical protein
VNKHSTDRSISFAIIKGGQLRLPFNLNVSSVRVRVRVRVRVGPGWQEEIGLTAADLVTMQTEYAKTSAALQKRAVEAGGCACTRTILPYIAQASKGEAFGLCWFNVKQAGWLYALCWSLGIYGRWCNHPALTLQGWLRLLETSAG